MVTIGMDVVQVLSKLKADICFMGSSSINVRLGLTEMGYEVSIIKKEMINASDKVIVLATSDKINGKMPHKVCGLDKIDAIVTELSPGSPRIKNFADAGARLF